MKQLNFLWRQKGHHTVSLGGKNTVEVVAGDRLTILTPGGGGHGTPPGALGSTSQAPTDGENAHPGETSCEEDVDRKARREAEMRMGGSLSCYRISQEQS